MPTVNIPYFARPPIDYNKYARNNMFPDATFAMRLQDEANRMCRVRLKSWSFGCPISAIPAAGGVTRDRWRCFIHTSTHHSHMYVKFIVAPTSGATAAPLVEAVFTPHGGIANAVAYTYFGNNTAISDVPANFGLVGSLTYEVGTGAFIQLTPDTDYEVQFSDGDNARMVAAVMYEIPLDADTANGFLDTGIQGGGPIYDAQRQSTLTMLRNAWKRNASPLITWAANTDALAPSTSNLTRNLLDTTIQDVSTSSPGFTIDTTFRSTIGRSSLGVPCIMWANTKTSTGTANVYLKDSSGTILATCSPSDSVASWVSSGLFYLPQTVAKYDLMQTASFQTTTTYGVSVFQYLA